LNKTLSGKPGAVQYSLAMDAYVSIMPDYLPWHGLTHLACRA